MIAVVVALAMCLGSAPVGAAGLALSDCVVISTDDVQLPAMVAGALVQLSVKEGSQVREGDVIGKIYDNETELQRAAARSAYAGAYMRWKSDIQVRYAAKSADVAEKEYEMILDANESSAKAVPLAEVMKKELEWEVAKLQIEKAKDDKKLALYDALSKQSESKAASKALERHTIRALFDGEVVKLERDQGEWVNPGDMILRLVSLDTMWVVGDVEAAEFDPHEIQGRDVTVEVEMARGRKEQVTGRITYVSSLISMNDTYTVRAEVTNRQEFGHWLLRPGMQVDMTIHLSDDGTSPLGVSRAQ